MERTRRKVRVGIVVSDARDKTVTVEVREPGRTPLTLVLDGPVVVSSSRPPSPCTTIARSDPVARSTRATRSASAQSATPTTWRVRRPGCDNGPRTLNTVRTDSAPRIGTTAFMAG